MFKENIKTSYFGDFEIEDLISEPIISYNLFQEEPNDSHKSQIKTFEKLERGISFKNAPSFGNQVHFQNAINTPIQRWYPYREGYSLKLVDTFIKELQIKGNVFDPFVGSGTTLISSSNNKLKSFGIDINPISALVAKVENDNYSQSDIIKINELISEIKNTTKSYENFTTNFELSEKIFNPEILHSLLQFRSFLKNIENKNISDLFFVAWLSILEDVSNVKKEGNGLKYKNRKRTNNGYINIPKEEWENNKFPVDKFNFVKSKILEQLNIIYDDIVQMSNMNINKVLPTVFNGNCLEFDSYFKNEIELTFYSPPYCNCFDYFEIHKVELWLGQFVNSKEDFRKIRNTGFRSNTNSINGKSIDYSNIDLEYLISLFNSEKLWNKRIPSVVRGYFDDTHTLLKKLYHQTSKGGYIGIVVGNSAYSGVIIPTDLLTANIAKEIGFSDIKIFVTRHLTTSSQQKKDLEFLKTYLRESIILIKK